MNIKRVYWILALVLIVSLVGCQQQQETGPVTAVEAVQNTENEPGRGGLDATNELVLGTLRLEGTANAMTSEQAADLLPLWQIIKGGSLKSETETAAVLTQIKGKMSESQLAAIQAMSLTVEDMQTWMAEQGIEMPAMPQDEAGAPEGRPNMSEDQRAQMQDMTDEERAALMAERGIERPEGQENAGQPGGNMRQANMLFAPLIDLLTTRAAA